MAFREKYLKRDKGQAAVPQYYNPATDDYEIVQGSDGSPNVKAPELKTELEAVKAELEAIKAKFDAPIDMQVTGSNLDQRGLAANKPLATAVSAGTTYWSVDTDPNADALEVSDGTNWTVMV